MSALRLLGISLAVFLLPCSVVAVLKRDVIVDAMKIEATEAQGKVLFFTAPSR